MSDDITKQAAASIRKRLALLKDDPQKWLAMIEEEIGYAMAAETAALQAENERLRERCEDADAAMESLKSLLGQSMPETLLGGVDYMIDHSNKGWKQVCELRKKTIDLEGMLATAHEAGKKAAAERDAANQRAERA